MAEAARAATSLLDQERATFAREKARLLQHYSGQFALVKGSTVVGTFSTFELAVAEGYARFGNVPFLVRQIVSEEVKLQVPALTLGLIHARL